MLENIIRSCEVSLFLAGFEWDFRAFHDCYMYVGKVCMESVCSLCQTWVIGESFVRRYIRRRASHGGRYCSQAKCEGFCAAQVLAPNFRVSSLIFGMLAIHFSLGFLREVYAPLSYAYVMAGRKIENQRSQSRIANKIHYSRGFEWIVHLRLKRSCCKPKKLQHCTNTVETVWSFVPQQQILPCTTDRL